MVDKYIHVNEKFNEIKTKSFKEIGVHWTSAIGKHSINKVFLGNFLILNLKYGTYWILSSFFIEISIKIKISMKLISYT